MLLRGGVNLGYLAEKNVCRIMGKLSKYKTHQNSIKFVEELAKDYTFLPYFSQQLYFSNQKCVKN